MKPLNQMSVPREQEKLLDANRSGAMDIASFDARLAQNETLTENILLQREDQEFENVLAGKAAHSAIGIA